MPKSKVTKTDLSEGVTRTPVKVKQTKTPVVWLTIMGVCLVLGLAWIIMYYLVAVSYTHLTLPTIYSV